MTAPLLSVLTDTPIPQAITRDRAAILDRLATNPILARHMARVRRAPVRRTALALPALVAAATALLIRVAQGVTMAGELLLVAAIGAAAWCGAAVTARTLPSGRWRPANDNPSRPCLPPHARW